jgi:hypothetical protein
VVSPGEPLGPHANSWKTIPGVQGLNDLRASYRPENVNQGNPDTRDWLPQLAHKGISLLNIPANMGAMAVSTVGMALATAMITAKVALYVLTGIQVASSTGFKMNGRAFVVSTMEIAYNIGEIGKDSILAVGDVAVLLGMEDVLERAKEFSRNAFQIFCRNL